jgi:hypothetical protein
VQIAGRTFGNPQLTGARAPFIDSSTKISFRPRIDGSCALSVVGETEGMFQIQNVARDKRNQQLCLVGSCMGAERPKLSRVGTGHAHGRDGVRSFQWDCHDLFDRL